MLLAWASEGAGSAVEVVVVPSAISPLRGDVGLGVIEAVMEVPGCGEYCLAICVGVAASGCGGSGRSGLEWSGWSSRDGGGSCWERSWRKPSSMWSAEVFGGAGEEVEEVVPFAVSLAWEGMGLGAPAVVVEVACCSERSRAVGVGVRPGRPCEGSECTSVGAGAWDCVAVTFVMCGVVCWRRGSATVNVESSLVMRGVV